MVWTHCEQAKRASAKCLCSCPEGTSVTVTLSPTCSHISIVLIALSKRYPQQESDSSYCNVTVRYIDVAIGAQPSLGAHYWLSNSQAVVSLKTSKYLLEEENICINWKITTIKHRFVHALLERKKNEIQKVNLKVAFKLRQCANNRPKPIDW